MGGREVSWAFLFCATASLLWSTYIAYTYSSTLYNSRSILGEFDGRQHRELIGSTGAGARRACNRKKSTLPPTYMNEYVCCLFAQTDAGSSRDDA